MGLINIAKKDDNRLSTTVKILALLNLVLAAAALFKDIFSAAYLGTTGEADALILAFSITDIMGNSLLAAAIGTSCVPVFSSLNLREDKREFNKGVVAAAAYVFVWSLVLMLLLIIFKDQIIGLLGRGFSEGAYSFCIKLFIVILPTFIMYPAIAIGISAMQVSGSFVIPAVAPIVFNIVYLFPLLLGYILNIPIQTGTYLTAIAITFGVMAMLVIIWYPLWRYKLKINFSTIAEYLRDGAQNFGVIKSILRVFTPYLLILLFTQGVLYIERYIGSGMGEGYVSGLNYAYRISQFPVWVFVSAVGAVVYPSIARYMRESDNVRLKLVIDRALNTVILVTIPMSIFLMFLRVPVTKVLFMRGAFDYSSLAITSDILLGYCIAIGGQSVAVISLKVLLASENTRKALGAYFVSFIVNIFMDFYLTPVIGIRAIGYGAAAGAILNGVLTYIAVRQKYEIKSGLKAGKMIIAVTANIFVVIVSVVCMNIWDKFICDSGFILELGFLLVSCAVCAVVYGMTIHKAGLI